MNEKENLNIFLKNTYKIYDKNSFETFVKSCLSYNIGINEYKKDISNLIKDIYKNVSPTFPDVKAKITVFDQKEFLKLSIKYEEKNLSNSPIIMLFPVFEENLKIIFLNLYNYMIKKGHNFKIKLEKNYKNPLLEIEVEKTEYSKEIINHYNNDIEIKNIIRSRIIPFFSNVNGVGIVCEYGQYYYKNFFIKKLFDFYTSITNIEEVDSNSFELYLERISKNEKEINEKRMNYVVYKSILCINDNKDPCDIIFKYDSNLELGSYNSSLFKIKTDMNGLIEFYGIESNINIKYGSEDYLNLVYSKFYENFIKKEKNEVFYAYFYSIIDKVLFGNYMDILKYFNFKKVNSDKIYQLMLCFSCSYFAYKKMGFTLEQVYEILDYVLLYDYGIVSNRNNNENIVDNSNNNKNELDSLKEEYANKVIDLKNGDKTLIKDYFKNNNVLNTIPLNSTCYLCDGSIVESKSFIYDLYKIIKNYDSFNDLVKDNIKMVEFK